MAHADGLRLLRLLELEVLRPHGLLHRRQLRGRPRAARGEGRAAPQALARHSRHRRPAAARRLQVHQLRPRHGQRGAAGRGRARARARARHRPADWHLVLYLPYDLLHRRLLSTGHRPDAELLRVLLLRVAVLSARRGPHRAVPRDRAGPRAPRHRLAHRVARARVLVLRARPRQEGAGRRRHRADRRAGPRRRARPLDRRRVARDARLHVPAVLRLLGLRAT